MMHHFKSRLEMRCHIVSSQIILHHRSTLHTILIYLEPSSPTSHHLTSHHITSHHVTSHHITSRHIISSHITSHHITSRHITSHHITSFCLTWAAYDVTSCEPLHTVTHRCESSSAQVLVHFPVAAT